ncbi:MAG TPA: hypothetical protein VM427_04850 [Patescibacteria group bacterium]|nr:hypothetical protein [Patescibacteria group bacterium]
MVRRVDPAVRSAIRPAIAWVDRQIIPIDALRPAAVDAVAAGDAPRPWSGVALDDLAGSGAGVA